MEAVTNQPKFDLSDLSSYRGRSILMLQGPVGPFFERLANDLKKNGAKVTKVNFHAGDWLFFRREFLWYRGTTHDWPKFCAEVLDTQKIDTILFYGDCRPAHSVAIDLAKKRGLKVGVFEEGYLRPNHITFEQWGVNGYSRLPREPQAYLEMPALPDVPERAVGTTYWHMVWWGFCYFTVGALGQVWLGDPLHHRKLSILESWPWIRSAWRKHWYRWKERSVETVLLQRWNRRYFLVPLQVHNDTQVLVHSPFESIEHLITEVIQTFAKSAPTRTALVFKHHPMDRGYRDYGRLIDDLSRKHELLERIFYIHDQHLPTLLDHARGVVVINSSVGLQALRHGVAVKALGEAIYNMPGLTHQGPLHTFWKQAPAARPHARLLRQFVRYLKHENQVNGSFYKRAFRSNTATGIGWLPNILSNLNTEKLASETNTCQGSHIQVNNQLQHTNSCVAR